MANPYFSPIANTLANPYLDYATRQQEPFDPVGSYMSGAKAKYGLSALAREERMAEIGDIEKQQKNALAVFRQFAPQLRREAYGKMYDWMGKQGLPNTFFLSPDKIAGMSDLDFESYKTQMMRSADDVFRMDLEAFRALMRSGRRDRQEKIPMTTEERIEFERRKEGARTDEKTFVESLDEDFRAGKLFVTEGRQKLDRSLELIDKMFTGSAANIKLHATKVMSEFIDMGLWSDRAANTEEFRALAGSRVAEEIKKFGSGTGLSDADREYAEVIAAGKVTMTPQALKMLLRMYGRSQINRFLMNNKLAADRYPNKVIPGLEGMDGAYGETEITTITNAAIEAKKSGDNAAFMGYLQKLTVYLPGKGTAELKDFISRVERRMGASSGGGSAAGPKSGGNVEERITRKEKFVAPTNKAELDAVLDGILDGGNSAAARAQLVEAMGGEDAGWTDAAVSKMLNARKGQRK